MEYDWVMKMLPMLPDGRKKVVRDAARAVKRMANLTIERVTTNTLSTLLGLPGMILTEYAIDQKIVVMCRSGNSSQQGRDILLAVGFEQVTSIAGESTSGKRQGL